MAGTIVCSFYPLSCLTQFFDDLTWLHPLPPLHPQAALGGKAGRWGLGGVTFTFISRTFST